MSFPAALAFTLPEEGGYDDNPDDHGGATDYGITQAVYDAYRTGLNLPTQSVSLIGQSEVSDIYQTEYWTPMGGNNLSSPLDVVCFDSAVNCGVSRASKWLQIALGVVADGVVGPKTLAALQWAGTPQSIANNVINQRELFYQQDASNNPSQQQFLAGWENRIAALRKVVQNG